MKLTFSDRLVNHCTKHFIIIFILGGIPLRVLPLEVALVLIDQVLFILPAALV